jgi:signal transduction histidine kinase
VDSIERSQLKSEIATLRLMLEVNEATALEQAARGDQAIAELRSAAVARERQATQLREVTEASIDAVFVLDAAWKVLYVNALGDSQVPAGNALGRPLFHIFPELELTPFGQHCRRVMQERVRLVFLEFRPVTSRWFEVSASPVGDGMVIFLRDVTDARRQEDALRRTEKLAAVGRLASSISHEINNPLESVVNLLYLIEHSESAGSEMRAYAKLATSELARVSHIVTQTLKFHRQSTRAQDTRIRDVLESVASLFQGRLNGMQVRMHRRFDENDTISCLAGDIRQVFANLIGNALDALSGRGDLWLRTRCSHHRKSGIEGLRITVADNGSGMSEKTRTNMFEAFYTTKAATGTGLGLWVSHGIIQAHGGRVSVRSSQREGRSGTVFSIFFPLHHQRDEA